jgi:hypothetical protein
MTAAAIVIPEIAESHVTTAQVVDKLDRLCSSLGDLQRLREDGEVPP